MTYLFDIGNVLLAFDFLPALNSLKGENPAPDAIEQILLKKDPFEAGEIPLAEYVQLLRDLLDYQGSDTDLFNAWNSIFTEIPATFQLAESLKNQGHRLILFSNTNPIHGPYCTEKHHLSERFDHAVFSYEINAIKPHDDFFTRAFEKFQIIPEETIYIDDLPENIAAGKRHGLRSFCYDHRKHDELLAWLETQTIE
ncbi:MAG: HAD family hydrolase [Akkermansiaceae bacterium]